MEMADRNNTQDSFDTETESGLNQEHFQFAQALQVPLLLLDRQFTVLFANDHFFSMFKMPKEAILGKGFFELGKSRELSELQQAFQELLTSKAKISNFSIPDPFRAKADAILFLNASLLSQEGDQILLSFADQGKQVDEYTTSQEFFMQAPAAIAVLKGPEHKYTYSNPLYERLFNRSREELIGKTVREVYPEIDGQGVYEIFNQVYKTGEAFVADEFPVSFDRDRKGEFESGFFNFIAHPIRNDTGEVTDIMIHAFEVTDQVLAKRKLEESERRYRMLINSFPSMIALYKGKDMIIEIANEAMMEAWGKGKEVVGKSLFTVLPEIKAQGFVDMIDGVFATGEPHKSYELPVELLRNGEPYHGYYNFMFYPRFDADGRVIGIFHTANEVTPEAEMNRKIRESEAHYRQIIDLLPDKITNNDPEGNAIYFNKAWRDFTGLSTEDMKLRGWGDAIHPDDLPLLLKKWKHSMETGEEYEIEYRAQNKEGVYFWQLTRGVPVRNEAGEIKMWITTATDIQKLKEEDKRKEEFLKMVSHELKTPVTSIKGYVQLLLALIRKNQENIPPSLPMEPSLDRINDQINRLTRLISDILDLSRLEYDKLQLKKQSLEINTLVEETVQDILYTNPKQSIRVIHNFNCRVMADKDRLGQVLINFITNAIKYSPGEKNVEVEISEAPQGQVAVSIRDKGIGIDKKDLEKIFQRFYRSQKAEENTYSGFGIGLFLAKEIVERHEGKVTVESNLGEGSVFTFYLPCL